MEWTQPACISGTSDACWRLALCPPRLAVAGAKTGHASAAPSRSVRRRSSSRLTPTFTYPCVPPPYPPTAPPSLKCPPPPCSPIPQPSPSSPFPPYFAHHARPPPGGGGSFDRDRGRRLGPVGRGTFSRGAGAVFPPPRPPWLERRVCPRAACHVRAAPLLPRRRRTVAGSAVPLGGVRGTGGYPHGLVYWPPRGTAHVPGTHPGELRRRRPHGRGHHRVYVWGRTEST